MKTVLIYLKGNKKPFEIDFQSQDKYEQFMYSLRSEVFNIVEVGPLSFAKSEFRYSIIK